MNRKRKIVFAMIAILFATAYAIYWAFFDIQRLKGQEVLQEVSSPDNTYTVTLYRNNGGATTSYSILGAVKNNESGKIRNIYWMYPCEVALVQWKDDTTVIINGVELDVRKDSYDYRINRKPDVDKDDWYVVIGDTTLHRYYNAIIDKETLEYLGTVPIA